MARFRTRLGWLAALTLTIQLGVTLAAAAAVCCKPDGSTPAAGHEMPCCKDGGRPGHICPLPAKKSQPPGTPVMKSCCDLEQQILAALLGIAGIPEASSQSVPFPELVLDVLAFSEQPVALVRPPDSPPPRL